MISTSKWWIFQLEHREISVGPLKSIKIISTGLNRFCVAINMMLLCSVCFRVFVLILCVFVESIVTILHIIKCRHLLPTKALTGKETGSEYLHV